MVNLATLHAEGNGVAKDEARALRLFLAALAEGDSYSTSSFFEKAQGLSKPLRMKLQESLKESGVYDGEIDGEFGPRTKAGIEKALSRKSG